MKRKDIKIEDCMKIDAVRGKSEDELISLLKEGTSEIGLGEKRQVKLAVSCGAILTVLFDRAGAGKWTGYFYRNNLDTLFADSTEQLYRRMWRDLHDKNESLWPATITDFLKSKRKPKTAAKAAADKAAVEIRKARQDQAECILAQLEAHKIPPDSLPDLLAELAEVAEGEEAEMPVLRPQGDTILSPHDLKQVEDFFTKQVKKKPRIIPLKPGTRKVKVLPGEIILIVPDEG